MKSQRNNVISKKLKGLFLILLIFSVFSIYSPIQDAEALTVWRFTPIDSSNTVMEYKNLTTAITVPNTVNTVFRMQITVNISGSSFFLSAGASLIVFCLANKINFVISVTGRDCFNNANPLNNFAIISVTSTSGASATPFMTVTLFDNSGNLQATTPIAISSTYINTFSNYTLYHWRNNGTGSGIKLFINNILVAQNTNTNNTMNSQTFNTFAFFDAYSNAGQALNPFELESVSIDVNGVQKYSKQFSNTPPDDYGQINNGYTIQKIGKGADTFFIPIGKPATLQVGDIGNITTRILFQSPINNSFYSLSSAHLTLWSSSNGGINYNNYSALYTDINGHVLFQFSPTETPTLGYYQFFIQYPGNVSGQTGYRGKNTSSFTIDIGTFLFLTDGFNLFDLISIGDVPGAGIKILQEFFSFIDSLILNPVGGPIQGSINVDQFRTRDSLRVFMGIPNSNGSVPGLPPGPPVYGGPNVNTNSIFNFIFTAIILPMAILFAIIFIVLIKFRTQTGTTEMVVLPFVLLGVNAMAWQSIIPQWTIIIEIIILAAGIAMIVLKPFSGSGGSGGE